MNICKSVMLLLACVLCAGMAKAQVAGTPYIVNGCVAPAAPGAITFTPFPPVVTLNGTFTATVPNVTGMTYTWSLPTGLTGSSTTNSITITGATGGTYDASAITVTATNSCDLTSVATAGSGTICVGADLRTDIPASIALGGYTWSTKNVDAPGTFTANAWDPGMFYQWDSKIGWSSSDPRTSAPAGQTWNFGFSSNTAWDMTNNNPCPTGWRVPTDVELLALYKLGSVWVDSCVVASLGLGSLPGCIYGTQTAPASYWDFNPNTMMFFPASGYRESGLLYGVGESAYLWSSHLSTVTVPKYATGIGIYRGSTLQQPGSSWNAIPITLAASVRCVVDCTAPAAPGAMTVTAATLVLSDSVVKLNGTFTASVPAVTGATSYTWTLPTGLSAASLTTTNPSITITGTTNGLYDAGTITVTANGACSNSAPRNSTTTLAVGCGAYVAPGVWKEFLCFNLGTDETVNPFTPTYATNGAYYQWGRQDPAASAPDATGADATAIPWSAAFPTGWFGSGGTPPTSATDVTKSAYDPCPSGYRVPTSNEWLGVSDPSLNIQESLGSWTSGITCIDCWSGTKFGPALMLPANGARLNANGSLSQRGLLGTYWSSKQAFAHNANSMHVNEGASTSYGIDTFDSGFGIRCIAQ